MSILIIHYLYLLYIIYTFYKQVFFEDIGVHKGSFVWGKDFFPTTDSNSNNSNASVSS